MGYGHWIYLSKGAMVPAGCFFWHKKLDDFSKKHGEFF